MRYLRLGVAWLLFVWLLGAGDLAAEARVEKSVVYGKLSRLALLMDVPPPSRCRQRARRHLRGSGNAWTAPAAK